MKHIARPSQSGFTLIEFLISITIGLILASAASYLFVTSQRIVKAQDAQAQRHETATMVMDIITRDLRNAGFYPASFPTTTSTFTVSGGYTNIVDITKPAFDQGVYGCTRGAFSLQTGLCPTAQTGENDSLVVNYFSDDTFTVEGVGTRRDCLRQNVGTASFNSVTYNSVRTSGITTSTATAVLPVFISNVYSLGGTQTIALDKQTTTTRSFRCAGNGNPASAQPLFAGVEQLRFKYGVMDASTTQAPARFYTASEVTALGSVFINGVNKTGWQRVVAVEVCILTKTLDNSARQVNAQGSYLDCDDATKTYGISDRALYQRQKRILGLRNNLSTTF